MGFWLPSPIDLHGPSSSKLYFFCVYWLSEVGGRHPTAQIYLCFHKPFCYSVWGQSSLPFLWKVVNFPSHKNLLRFGKLNFHHLIISRVVHWKLMDLIRKRFGFIGIVVSLNHLHRRISFLWTLQSVVLLSILVLFLPFPCLLTVWLSSVCSIIVTPKYIKL